MNTADEAIILAGGFGTRLRTVVSDVPKPLAPVAGRPFLTWILDQLSASGIRRCVLATGYMAETVEAVIGHKWQSMEVVYSVEPEPLGTGGAIRLAAHLLNGNGAHVLNGDTWLRYSPQALEKVTRDVGAEMGVALAQVPDVARYGAVKINGARVSSFLEKGQMGHGYINAGCYFLSAMALESLPKEAAFSFEHRVLQAMAQAGQIAAYTQTAEFIDIGVPEDFLRAQEMFRV